MTKKFLSFFKYMTLVSVVFFFVAISGCDDDDDTIPPFSGTLLELLSDDQFKESATVTDDKALDSMAKYVNKYPAIQTLLGQDNKTLFAFSNKAFKNLLATPGFPSNVNQISDALIQGVMAYHIANTEIPRAEMTGGLIIPTNYSDTNPCTGAATVQNIEVNSDAD
ncbi:MAG: hypothetical protein HC811_07710, partial [Flammeovirgaceae bacterium]|nr:hypothetical protein [Flammeovirgaceae bacterium]